MVVRLEGTVNEEMVDILIKAENETPIGEELIVFFNSPGGRADSMEVLLDIINESDKISVVKVYSVVYSAGFILTMRCQKYVEILEGCLGMAHRAFFPSVGVKDNLKISKDILEEMKIASKSAKKLIKDLIKLNIFTKKEVKRIKKGDDVFFSTKRLREMREVIWSPIQAEIDEYIKEMNKQIEEDKDRVPELPVEDINVEAEVVKPKRNSKKKDEDLEIKE